MASTRTYRHKLTGLVADFPREFGDIFKDVLEEVEDVISPADEVVEEPATPTTPNDPAVDPAATNEGSTE